MRKLELEYAIIGNSNELKIFRIITI
jgi:hypothetical protein